MTKTLREAIQEALRRRSPKTVSMMLACDVEAVEREITVAIDSSPDEDLPYLAESIGLRADGSDPAQEFDEAKERARRAELALQAERQHHETTKNETRQDSDSLLMLLSRIGVECGPTWKATVDRGLTRFDEIRRERDAALISLAQEVAAHAATRSELASVTTELNNLKWSVGAYQQDLSQFSRIVGRTTYEMVFENDKGVRQTPTAYVLGDGRAYAPIFGSEAELFPSLDELGADLAPALGNGFRFVGAEKVKR